SFVVGAITEHLQNDLRYVKDLGTVRKDLAASADVLRVGISGFQPSTSFQHDFETGLGKIRDYRRYKRYAPLSRKAFSGNTNYHEASSLVQSFSAAKQCW